MFPIKANLLILVLASGSLEVKLWEHHPSPQVLHFSHQTGMDSTSLSCKQSHCPQEAGCLPSVTSLLGSMLSADGLRWTQSMQSCELQTSLIYSASKLVKTLGKDSGKVGTQRNTNDKDNFMSVNTTTTSKLS